MDYSEAVGFSLWRDRAREDGKSSVILEALNITSLATAFDSLIERGSAMFITEHATPVKYHAAWRRRARAKGYVLHMGPTDPDVVDGHRAGVGFLAPTDFCATLMPPMTDSFRRAVALGRVLRVVLSRGQEVRGAGVRHLRICKVAWR